MACIDGEERVVLFAGVGTVSLQSAAGASSSRTSEVFAKCAQAWSRLCRRQPGLGGG